MYVFSHHHHHRFCIVIKIMMIIIIISNNNNTAQSSLTFLLTLFGFLCFYNPAAVPPKLRLNIWKFCVVWNMTSVDKTVQVDFLSNSTSTITMVTLKRRQELPFCSVQSKQKRRFNVPSSLFVFFFSRRNFKP